MICIHCGQEAPGGRTFCVHCGGLLEFESEDVYDQVFDEAMEEEADRLERNSRNWMIYAVYLLLFAVTFRVLYGVDDLPGFEEGPSLHPHEVFDASPPASIDWEVPHLPLPE